jgi:hypothetical protein
LILRRELLHPTVAATVSSHDDVVTGDMLRGLHKHHAIVDACVAECGGARPMEALMMAGWTAACETCLGL